MTRRKKVKQINSVKKHGRQALCKPNIHVSRSTSELRVRLARRETGLSPPVKPQLHCNDFGHDGATTHPDLSSRDASA